ncbi:hypothetical protein [Paenibacillus agaridevorans]|uniref:hypothetical protein n=1 Tax=Paenibacillus agaridevorans TaxID=171404 RepID=UPI001BE4789C|nr:hypothetical protein [Paenibacillus agaridevorans]
MREVNDHDESQVFRWQHVLSFLSAPSSALERERYVSQIWHNVQVGAGVVETNPKMIPDGLYHMVINMGSAHTYIDDKGRRWCPEVMSTPSITTLSQ